jgi:hypothetical protein
MKTSKRSQMEIMGLAIIVIIIIFGVLLSLIFFKPQDSSLKTDITDSTLASNTLNVILKTTLDCKDIELKNLLQDCAEDVRNKEYCNSTDKLPCAKVEKIINESILKNTLVVWKKQYTFRATVLETPPNPSTQLMQITNTAVVNGKAACYLGSKKYTTVISESYPIPLKDGKTMEITLDICR